MVDDPMRYDLVIIGEADLAHREAVQAARENHLVAVVRTAPVIDSVFRFPLDTWSWPEHPTWKSLRTEFYAASTRLTSVYVRHGIELFEGRPIRIESHSLTISTPTGQQLELAGNRFEFAGSTEIDIPGWLRTEVPNLTRLSGVSQLRMLPESVFIEGNSLAALRLAVVCARLNRNVILCSAGWNAPETSLELAELEEEAAERGIRRLEPQELHSVHQTESGEFDIWLLEGDVCRTGLYVYATEPVREPSESLELV